MAERKRDLSGFGLPSRSAKSKPRRNQAEPGRVHATRETSGRPTISTSTRSAAVVDKKRITLSLPTAVAVRLRRVAETEERFYLDIILTAFVAHAEAVDRDLRGQSRPPARRAAGRTQIPLNILPEDLGVIDQRAKGLGLDRSAYVAELLTRALT